MVPNLQSGGRADRFGSADAEPIAAFAPSRGDFGNVDNTPYENVAVPTLLTAGAQDKLREAGYADEIGARIPNCTVIVYDPCGHCPNVERADEWNATVIDWLDSGPRPARAA